MFSYSFNASKAPELAKFKFLRFHLSINLVTRYRVCKIDVQAKFSLAAPTTGR